MICPGLRAVLSACLILTASHAEARKKEADGIAVGAGVVVTLTGEREIKGLYLGRRDGALWVGIDEGEIGIEPETILRITPTRTSDSEFQRRKAALSPKDAAGHWKLAEWALAEGLDSSAKSTALIVVGLEPDHKEARRLLGHEQFKGRWMAHDEVMAEKGLVEYNGEWITKAEYSRRMAQRRSQHEDATRRTRGSIIIRTYSYPSFYQPRSNRSGYTESYRKAPKGSIR